MAGKNRTITRWSLVVAALAATAAVVAPSAPAKVALPASFPAAGELVKLEVVVRARPDPGSRMVRKLRQFRPTFHLQEILALEAQRGADGLMWYRLSLPGRPNGQRGWVRADQVEVKPARNRIVVYRGARRIEVRRIADDALLLRAKVAIGAPGAETPLGRNYYVQSRFVPTNSFLGTFRARDERVLEAVRLARRRHSRHPRHAAPAAPRPGRLPRLRTGAQPTANALRRLAPTGTPIDILP